MADILDFAQFARRFEEQKAKIKPIYPRRLCCLECEREFVSHGPGNRVCPVCRDAQAAT